MVQRIKMSDETEYMEVLADDGDYVYYEDYEKLRLLLAEVILRFSVFDGDFMTRLVDTLEEG